MENMENDDELQFSDKPKYRKNTVILWLSTFILEKPVCGWTN